MADRQRAENCKFPPCTPRELLGYTFKVLSTFNARDVASDAHLQAFFNEQSLQESDEVFITEVFAGCIRYSPLLKVVVDGYYATDGKISLKSEAPLYNVISYLVMFRLNDLGMSQFKRLINSQSTMKMLRFLRFFFNEANLYGWIRDEWYKMYDKCFVDDNIMPQIKRHEAEIREYIEVQLVAKDSHTHSQAHNQKIPVTEVKPFNLTNPKPRRIPTPEKIPVMKPHKMVPESTYIPPIESELVKTNRDTLKQRAEKKVEESERMKFTCANTEKSIKTKNVIRQILEEKEAKLETVTFKSKPYPATIMSQQQPTKLNTAAILREGARIQKGIEDENKRLADLEAGHKDTSEYEKWQEEVKQKDQERQLAETKKKHLESMLSYEEAILARQNHIMETQEKVVQIKEEYDEIMREYFSRKQEEKKDMRRLVEEVMKGHKNTQEAKLKLKKMKQKIVQQVDKESQELMSKALEQAEQEMRQKVELIQQIRAMESVPVVRIKFVDRTETSGQGLLAEMSLAELKERLSLMKICNEEAKEKKRKEIAAAKKAKETLLSETLEVISRSKSTQQTAHQNDSASRRTQKQNTESQKEQPGYKLQELEQKLEAKRKVREQIKKDRIYSPTKNSNIKIMKPQAKNAVNKESSIDTLLRATVETISSNS